MITLVISRYRIQRFCTLAGFLVFLALTGACATNPVTGQQDLVLMSERDELALGNRTRQQVMQEYAVYDEPDLQAYVQYVGTRLATNSHRSNLNYTFTVLDSREVNAFALPGGHIFITRGLMAYLNTEAELAAVLGHEIGHVTARHAVRQYSASQLAGIGIGLGSILLGSYQSAGQQLGSLLGGALLSGYGREHELEADRLGAEYLARTAYDPGAMLDVIRILKNQETYELQRARAEGRQPHVYHGLFSTHPDNDTRLQDVIRYADRISPTDSPYTGKDSYLARIDGLAYGYGENEGIVRGRDFYHSNLDIYLRFPDGWRIDNHSNSLTAMDAGGNAMIQLALKPASAGVSAGEFFQTLGLGSLTNESDFVTGGSQAHTGIATINTNSGQRLARITVIKHQSNFFILAGVTGDPQAIGRYDGAFLNTARSFRPLREQERLLAQPLRLKLIRAGDNTRYRNLALNSGLDTLPEEQLRLLNGHYPAGEPQTGDLIKTVQ